LELSVANYLNEQLLNYMMGSTNESTFESFSDIFPTSWDNFGSESLNIDGIFNSLGDASSTLAPPMHPDAKRQTMDGPSSSDSDQSLSPQHPVGLKKPTHMVAEPITKARNGPGRIPRNRPKPQNMFSVWTQPQQMAPPPMMAPMGYPTGSMTSPYMATAEMMAGGSPTMMGITDPYSWMQGRQQKRPSPFFGNSTSPSLLYNPYGGPMGSPPFAYQPHMGAYPMYQPPPSMKLPVQALHRPAEPANHHDSGIGMVAPLLIPAEMGKAKAASNSTASASAAPSAEVDPSAIPTAISSFLGGNTDSGRVANMDMYVMTFKSFVQEESEIDYSNVTVLELKRLLRKYQLAAQGKKDDLIKMVKDVAGFLKQMPIFEEGTKSETKEASKVEKATEAMANQTEKNTVQDSMDRYLA
jgi:hypothetical protein